MLDFGSMSCTHNEEGELKLQAAGVLPCAQPAPANVVLGCGGLNTQPKRVYDLTIEVYWSKSGKTSIVPGQRDKFIIGTRVIKSLIQALKSTEKYWELIYCSNSNPECEQFFELLSCTFRWSGSELPSRIGTVRLRQAVGYSPPSATILNMGEIVKQRFCGSLSLWSPPQPARQ